MFVTCCGPVCLETKAVKPRGMTLVEVMMALVIITIGIMSLMSQILTANALSSANSEELIAYSAAREMVSNMESYERTTGPSNTFDTLFSAYIGTKYTAGTSASSAAATSKIDQLLYQLPASVPAAQVEVWFPTS